MSTTTQGQGGAPRWPSNHQWHEGPSPGHYQLRVGYADTLIVRPSVVPGAWLLDCPGIGFRGSPICGARDVAHARALAVVMVSSRIEQLATAVESLPQAALRD